MKNSSLYLLALKSGTLAGLLGLASLGTADGAEAAATNSFPHPSHSISTTNLVENASTNAAPLTATNSAPVESKHGITITTDGDDDDDSTVAGKKHTITIGGDHENSSVFDSLEDILIPLAGILASFGTPILIVFFVCYYKYKRRQENLALVREYLAKGMPVPPQLLDDSQREYATPTATEVTQGSHDVRKGFKYAFVGLGLALALYINWPHSTTWGWGLIPMVIGIGYVISGTLQMRAERERTALSRPATPPQNEPPR